jgi:histone deacetylase 1/2
MASPVHSDTSSSSGDEAPPQAPAAASTLHTINIRNHVPVILDLDQSNYGQWRCLFDSVFGKFGLYDAHIRSPPPVAQRDAEWRMVDCCVVNWLHTTIAKPVFDIIYKPHASAFTVWGDIEGVFRDNELQRATYYEAEFRSLQQGDMSITEYTMRLKQLADSLRDVGYPVSEPSQVLNLLRGLNPKFRHVKPVINSKTPPHSFMSARSYLLLEEIQLQHDAKQEAGHALYASKSASQDSTASDSRPGDSTGSRSSDGGSTNRGKGKSKRRGKGASSSGGSQGASGGGGGGGFPQRPGAPWTTAYNPWTGLVQAWTVPFRPPSAGVLGPRPPFQAQQAMTAQYLPPPVDSNISGAWDNSALYTALQTAGVNTQQPPSAADWYFDTGASAHMSSSPGILAHPQPLTVPASITVGNGAKLPVTHTASAVIPTSSSPLRLNDVLVSPPLVKNLISVKKLTRDNNISIEFDPTGFSIKDLPTREVKLRCDSPGDLYPLRLPRHSAFVASSTPSVALWHARLGHPGTRSLSRVLNNFNFQCNKSSFHTCHSCQVGKHVRLPFNPSVHQTFFPFQIVHSDVWTSPVYSNSGYKYYVVLLDDFTHFVWTFPIRQKSEVFPIICNFFSYVRTQFGLHVLALQTDNGKEYDSTAMRSFLANHGAVLRLSCPYTSQQNGKAERVLRTLNDCVRTMLIHSGAPLSFWAEALQTAAYLLNRRPCRATGTTTPHDLLLGVPPRYDELRVFGCLCYPNTTSTSAHKLSPRSVACVFLGYPGDHRGYRCYDVDTRRVYTSRHVVFDEDQFPFFTAQQQRPPPSPHPCICDDPVIIHAPAPAPHRNRAPAVASTPDTRHATLPAAQRLRAADSTPASRLATSPAAPRTATTDVISPAAEHVALSPPHEHAGPPSTSASRYNARRRDSSFPSASTPMKCSTALAWPTASLSTHRPTPRASSLPRMGNLFATQAGTVPWLELSST